MSLSNNKIPGFKIGPDDLPPLPTPPSPVNQTGKTTEQNLTLTSGKKADVNKNEKGLPGGLRESGFSTDGKFPQGTASNPHPVEHQLNASRQSQTEGFYLTLFRQDSSESLLEEQPTLTTSDQPESSSNKTSSEDKEDKPKWVLPPLIQSDSEDFPLIQSSDETTSVSVSNQDQAAVKELPKSKEPPTKVIPKAREKNIYAEQFSADFGWYPKIVAAPVLAAIKGLKKAFTSKENRIQALEKQIESLNAGMIKFDTAKATLEKHGLGIHFDDYEQECKDDPDKAREPHEVFDQITVNLTINSSQKKEINSALMSIKAHVKLEKAKAILKKYKLRNEIKKYQTECETKSKENIRSPEQVGNIIGRKLDSKSKQEVINALRTIKEMAQNEKNNKSIEVDVSKIKVKKAAIEKEFIGTAIGRGAIAVLGVIVSPVASVLIFAGTTPINLVLLLLTVADVSKLAISGSDLQGRSPAEIEKLRKLGVEKGLSTGLSPKDDSKI